MTLEELINQLNKVDMENMWGTNSEEFPLIEVGRDPGFSEVVLNLFKRQLLVSKQAAYFQQGVGAEGVCPLPHEACMDHGSISD